MFGVFPAIIGYSHSSSSILQRWLWSSFMLSGEKIQHYIICIVFAVRWTANGPGTARHASSVSIQKWLTVKSPPFQLCFVVFTFNAFQCQYPLCTNDAHSSNKKSKSCAGTKNEQKSGQQSPHTESSRWKTWFITPQTTEWHFEPSDWWRAVCSRCDCFFLCYCAALGAFSVQSFCKTRHCILFIGI